jgi:hypothetical protein
MRGGFKKIKRITGYYHEKSVLGLEFIYELSKMRFTQVLARQWSPATTAAMTI